MGLAERPGRPRIVALWLLGVALAIFVMAVIGAITRLTESGLSITQWKPISGAIPPLTEAAWAEEYRRYLASPEGETVHRGISLEAFKGIFFWEWLHRLWGRLIGLFYAVPLAVFWLKGWISRRDVPALVGLLLLGGLQGFVGWFMVMSGLVDRPTVSHYRLAMHLCLALLLYAACIWQALRIGWPATRRTVAGSLALHVRALLALLAVTVVWGAFTAGLDAGLVYNTFPTMDGDWLPPEMLSWPRGWLTIFDEPGAVQFTHRVLALSTAALALWLAVRLGFAGERRLAVALAAAVVLQVSLGIGTILTQVELHTAATHQAGAILLLGIVTAATYRCTRRVAAAG